MNTAIQNELDVSPVSQVVETVSPQQNRFQFHTAAQLLDAPPIQWRVKGVFPVAGLATIYGPSGSGKSFLVLDLMAAIANGDEWHKCTTESCRILYLALEGQAGLRQRVEAWQQHYEREYPSGVVFMTTAFSLTATRDVSELEAAMKAAKGFDIVVIDTLNRAAPNADENSSLNMSQILSATGKLQAETNGLIILVHHTGKDASRGMRGHSSLFAAMDAVVEVKRNGDDRAWQIAKAKDGRDGEIYPFKLQEIKLKRDDNCEATSCVVIPCEDAGKAFDQSGGKKLTTNQKIVKETIDAMLDQSDFHGEGSASADTPCVLYKDVIEQAKVKIPSTNKHAAERVKQALKWLVLEGYYLHEDNWLWRSVDGLDSQEVTQ